MGRAAQDQDAFAAVAGRGVAAGGPAGRAAELAGDGQTDDVGGDKVARGARDHDPTAAEGINGQSLDRGVRGRDHQAGTEEPAREPLRMTSGVPA